MKLTTKGVRFYRDSVEMLKSFEETIRKFQTETSLHRERKVGMGPALSRRMRFGAVASFEQRYPKIRLVVISINDRAELGDEGIDVLIRPRSARQRGSEHKQPQAPVLRKLAQHPSPSVHPRNISSAQACHARRAISLSMPAWHS